MSLCIRVADSLSGVDASAWDALAQRERAVAEYKKALDNGNNYDNAQKTAQKFMEQPFDQKKARQVASN